MSVRCRPLYPNRRHSFPLHMMHAIGFSSSHVFTRRNGRPAALVDVARGEKRDETSAF